MASNLVTTPVDVYQLINNAVWQATGKNPLANLDTTNYAGVGNLEMVQGFENTINAISTVLTRTIFAVRPYTSRYKSLNVSDSQWGAQYRKITPLMRDAEASQDWNTDINPNQLADGQSIDMYKINKPKVVQFNFYGSKTLEKSTTIFRHQLNQAFRSRSEFMAFVDAVMMQFYNDIELINEQRTRLTLNSFIAGLQAMGGARTRDMIAEYNTFKGTTYTREEIMSNHLTEFMQFFISELSIISDAMVDMTTLHHATVKDYNITRFTPKSKQRLFIYSPLLKRAEASVFSEIFNPLYLQIKGGFDTVAFWQNPQEPSAINITPNILNTETGAQEAAEEVSIPYVAAVMFDREALGVQPKFDYESTTPFNSAGGYWNVFHHWNFNAYMDYTENAILFTLGPGGEPAAIETAKARKR